MPIALKIVIAVSIILSASWLSGKRPELAGFLTALPLVSILALAFSYTDHGSLAQHYPCCACVVAVLRAVFLC
jgi:hypothetical protein